MSAGWFPARRRGQCAVCAGFYAVGTLIQPYEPTGGWRAECCDPDAECLADIIRAGESRDGGDVWRRLLERAAQNERRAA